MITQDAFAGALARRFAPRWQVGLDGSRLRMRPTRPLHHPAPPRAPHTARSVTAALAAAFARHGIPSADLLPIRWGRDTDLTVSAVQGLDPWLKDGRDAVWREGFLPQPVVRTTGERDARGRLREGFLTSFVNISTVLRVDGLARHLDLLDAWFTALSALGVHAGRLDVLGDLEPWHRGPVSGLTLFVRCDGVDVCDAGLLWRNRGPRRAASDIGGGLERLLWAVNGQDWNRVVFGADAEHHDTELLDAVRTATLLAMGGVRPAATGPGSTLRRILRAVPAPAARTGLGRVVRAQRDYWAGVGMAGPAWPALATVLEDEILAR